MGAGHPFGEDFLNFWSGAHLAVTGQAGIIYDLAAFHAFETGIAGAPIDLYHYSYPPVMWLISAPFGLLPYPLAWAAWQLLGWGAFALAVRRLAVWQLAPAQWLLVALAVPAVFINAMGGQNGCWTAAIIGWGLILLRERPAVAGMILALFVVKPQLGWLIPLALLAGRQYRALAAFIGTALALILITLPLFGIDAWIAYVQQGSLLKSVILEYGDGTWHRMLSIFVLVRHVGAPIPLAYAAQAIASLTVALLVLRVWHREGPTARAKALLVLGVLAGSLYVSDYDCVMALLAALWLWPQATAGLRGRMMLLLAMPLFAAPLALISSVALGALALWPALLGAGLRRTPYLAEDGLR
ncbi:glycosyltransferase family 87 protein [Sphingobium yanoikuyae]|uniref:glycosyltransferase family 87 protein n=1 Tax=Sphingobium yanoikuyae TaxID=13690 RepID=UPI00345F0D20